MIGRRAAAVLLGAIGCCAPAFAQSPSGQSLFEARCATCHRGTDPRTPTVDALRQRSPEAILQALTTGVMRTQGEALSVAERQAVADFLGTRGTAGAAASGIANRCSTNTPFTLSQGPAWRGWGPDATNARFQTASAAGLTVEQIPRLTLKWAFGFPNATSARAQPTVAGGRVFVGSQDGTVYSLDAKTGCTFWAYKAAAAVRTAITIGPGIGSAPGTAYFGDGRSTVYAVNASTGTLVWTQKVETHPASHITAAPTLHDNRLYIAVSSLEEGRGNDAAYECCTFRGSVLSLNAVNGNVIWKTYTIPQEPRTLPRRNAGGAVRWGPAGAGIWSAPTIDAKRRRVYVATGNMYTEPQQDSSDAVLALELDTGKLAWSMQATSQDVFVVGCNQNGANCPTPDTLGPDFDFGNSPMLTTVGGRDLIVIGQKSAVGWALDPDRQGAVVWKYQAGNGSALGGMEFGSTTDGVRAYFPLADGNQPTAGELHAVDLATGARIWKAPPPEILCGTRGRGCTPAILAAISSIPGAVFAGASDGGLRAYRTDTGEVIWTFDTNRDFTTVNGVPAKGASMSGPGPAVAGGMVFANSGYGSLGGRPGNVLLAFGVD